MLLRVIAAGFCACRGAFLAPGVALVTIEGSGQGDGSAPITIAGRPPKPPYGSVDVGTEHAPARIVVFRLPADGPAADSMLVLGDDGAEMLLDPADLDTDPLSIAIGLDRAAKRRLLDFFLSFCRPAFRLGRVPAFAQACARLARDCVETIGTAQLLGEVLPDHVLVAQVRGAAGATLVVIRANQVVHSRLPVLTDDSFMQIIPRVMADDLIVSVGRDIVAWNVVGPAALTHVLALSEDGPAVRAACRRALATHRSAAARDLLRDIALLFPAPPSRLADPAQPLAGEIELAVPDGEGGVFIAGWLRDPLGRVKDITVATANARLPLAADALHRIRRADIEKRFAAAAHAGAPAEGFVLHLPDVPDGPNLQPHLLLRLHSGAELRLIPTARSLSPAAARDAVLGSVPPGVLTPAIMRLCLAPAAARLHRAAMAEPGTPEIIRFGRPPIAAAVSIVIPLYRNLGFLRLQMAALAEDRQARDAEIVFVLDSPEQGHEVEHLLRGLYRLTELPVTLVVMARNRGYAAACNAGANASRAKLILLLNSDVIPAVPGWLGCLMAPFCRASVTAAGPKLLFDDASIQHAGLFFEQDEDGIWFNRHHHKGMPRFWVDASDRRQVPAVTGAALIVRRSAFEQVGGVCEDYVIGDYEDSDLCLRLRAAGGTILYLPEAELFHFERRSIQLHRGYARTHAALYNRLLHHRRWDGAMSEAMAGSDSLPRGSHA